MRESVYLFRGIENTLQCHPKHTCVCVSLFMHSDHACKIFDATGGDVLIDLDILGNKRGGADVVDPNLDFSALVM